MNRPQVRRRRIRSYPDLMLERSVPVPARRTPPSARADGYIEQMITRGVPAIAPRRDPELLRITLYQF
jgi:hypothetical protein